MKNFKSIFLPATENYKIDSGAYSFFIYKHGNSDDNRIVNVKCKFLKTAIRRVLDEVDYNDETIDYEVAVNNKNNTTFINLYDLKSGNPILSYLS